MNCQQFSEVLIDVYYNDADAALVSSAHEHRSACAHCQESWEGIAGISQAYRSLSDESPSQMSYNKIMVYARERCERKKMPLWRRVWQPAASFAVMALLAVVSFVQFRATPVATVADNNHPVPSPMLSLPDAGRGVGGGFETVGLGENNYQLNRFLGGAKVTSVSQGFQGLEDLSVADGLDQKMLNHSLDDHELETLYYRARKSEKLGQYRDAFNDYEFITRFYPNYANSRFALIGMARCLQGLDQKDDAVAVVQRYQQIYGNSVEVQGWLDSLKSETF